MSLVQPTQPAAVLVAIDIAKLRHDVLIEAPGWKNRKRLILPNTAAEFRLFADYLHGLKRPVRVVFEATGNYHRPLAHFLQSEGFHLELIASLAVARTRDLRRFNHHRQFLKFCGLDLSTQQSGQFRGTTKLSKYGNARLRCAFWMAATVAVRLRENSFRDKFERYLRRDPLSADRKRMAYVAVAAKMARVAHGIIKTGTDFRCFFEAAAPSGRATSHGPSRP